MKNLEILKKIDNFIFSKLDQFQDHPEYQKFNDAYGALEERVQEIIKAGLAITIIIFPLLIIMIFSLSNSSLKEELRMKEEIITMSHELIQEQALIKNAENTILGRQMVDSQSALQDKITAVVNQSGLDANNIQVSKFSLNDLKGNIIETKINVKYTSLSNDNLFNFINTLVAREKVKVETLVINKNQASNLLDGMLILYYFSKDNLDEQQ